MENLVNLETITTRESLLADVNEAIATLLGNAEYFPNVGEMKIIAEPLLAIRIALMEKEK